MTDPASGYIPDVIFIGLWGFLAGFGLCLWLVQRAERIKDKTKAEAKP
jgi:type IV secretory pathway TrbD component